MNTLSKLLNRIDNNTLDSIARFLAFVLYRVIRLRRQLVIKNISNALGSGLNSKEIDEIAYLSYYHFICTLLEFLSDRSGLIGKNAGLTNSEHLKEALQKNKGAFIVCCHLGNWEAMGGAVTNQIKPAHIVVKKVGSEGLNDFVVQQRKQIGFNCIEKGSKGSAYKSILKILKRGEVIGFAMDQARPSEPRLPFFGVDAKTNTSLAAIWKKTHAPLVPAFIERKSFGSHTVRFFPEIVLKDSCAPMEESQSEIIENTNLITKEIERMILMAPEQYFWLHNRWK